MKKTNKISLITIEGMIAVAKNIDEYIVETRLGHATVEISTKNNELNAEVICNGLARKMEPGKQTFYPEPKTIYIEGHSEKVDILKACEEKIIEELGEIIKRSPDYSGLLNK